MFSYETNIKGSVVGYPYIDATARVFGEKTMGPIWAMNVYGYDGRRKAFGETTKVIHVKFYEIPNSHHYGTGVPKHPLDFAVVIVDSEGREHPFNQSWAPPIMTKRRYGYKPYRYYRLDNTILMDESKMNDLIHDCGYLLNADNMAQIYRLISNGIITAIDEYRVHKYSLMWYKSGWDRMYDRHHKLTKGGKEDAAEA